MADPTEADIRTTIQVSDTSVLSSAQITLFLADAKTITGLTDEIALRYYVCYLIADNWDSIAGVNSIEGVSFKKPNPEGFLRAFNKRAKQLMAAAGNNVGMAKISTNPDFTYDATENRFRQRRGSDPYY